ncbi:MAG TPA: SMI1/KNR4 family protein [Puia sp.]|nr:SMI1/KNR4 family protein [Puia sp.]
MLDINSFLGRINKNSPPSETVFSALLEKIDFTIDKTFLHFMKNYNGASGCIDGGKCFNIWQIEDILKLNPYYDFIEQSKSLFFFGSNGSSFGYAFNKLDSSIIGIEYLDIGTIDPEIIASSFDAFLSYLSVSN